jgi:hypothetical protein
MAAGTRIPAKFLRLASHPTIEPMLNIAATGNNHGVEGKFRELGPGPAEPCALVLTVMATFAGVPGTTVNELLGAEQAPAGTLPVQATVTVAGPPVALNCRP